ncbi:inorganic pyrophosphatase 2-like [Prosopis cineraria]|uniref:inorganic pyrophosphatase 2-like n=1 Tax=Prosopis cineraria TaxID=364024 RepID=UPI0024103C56|nr:inorganic pyrophosphatase 2-like [Prosopis cineraria]
MSELHSQGKSMEQIVQVLKRTPMHPHIVPAIEAAYSLGCDLKIVSDANIFFIRTILEHHGVSDRFSEIIANPSFVDEEGRLRIFPYHDYLKSSHECNLCPPNMCKGKIIERIQKCVAEEGKSKKFIYLGDGSGDFCPSLRLKDTDSLMPRKDFALCDLVSKNSNSIKAEVHGWVDGDELMQVLLRIINSHHPAIKSSEDSTPTMAVDCKKMAGPTPMDAPKNLPQAIPVPPLNSS